jgi:NAD-dependent SIR2 family protein deacetylase
MMSDSDIFSHDEAARVHGIIDSSDSVIVGAGSGLSSAAGLLYFDFNTFDKWFPGYYQQYGIKYIYHAAFFDFPSIEEFYAYWARHISIIRYNYPTGDVYSKLLRLVKDKSHFVITTNVDGQFAKAGFNTEKIYSPQGDYAFFQCSVPCKKELYHNSTLIESMLEDLEDNPFAIKTKNIPHCPNCGSLLVPNIRKTINFVEEPWKQKSQDYHDFLKQSLKGTLLLLELGVGFNTPSIIRFPFEYIVANYKNTTLVRVNLNETKSTIPFAYKRSLLYNVDANSFMNELTCP